MTTAARLRLVDALKLWDYSGISSSGVQVVGGPAELIVPPALAVVPDDPYWEPATYCTLIARLRVSVFAARANAPDALTVWEALAGEVWACVGALRGAVALSAGRTTTVTVGESELFAGSVTVRMEG